MRPKLIRFFPRSTHRLSSVNTANIRYLANPTGSPLPTINFRQHVSINNDLNELNRVFTGVHCL